MGKFFGEHWKELSLHLQCCYMLTSIHIYSSYLLGCPYGSVTEHYRARH